MNTNYVERTADFEVFVQTWLEKDRSDLVANQFFYCYWVTILNHGSVNARIIYREWIINDDKKQYKVDGKGLGGDQPELKSGQLFKHIGFAPLHNPFGNMRGRFQVLTDDGKYFWITVPLFFFRPDC
jgi:ApaG protein